MTSQPDILPQTPGDARPGEDTEGCACVVASYQTTDALASEVAEDAGTRIMVTPALGDFFELSFIAIGPEPGRSGDRSAAVRLITEALLQSDSDATRSYFALVVIGRSATETEQLLAECAGSKILRQLAVRLRGVAMLEDRANPGRGTGGHVVVAPPGAWSKAYLVSDLRRYADELMREFAVIPGGITREGFDSLQTTYAEEAAGHDEQPPPETTTQSHVASVSSPPRAIESQAAQPAPVLVAPPTVSATTAPLVSTAPPAPPPSPSPRVEPTAPEGRLRRLLVPPWHRRAQGETGAVATTAARDASAGDAAAGEPDKDRTLGLVYLLIIGDDVTDNPVAWQRGRTTLLSVDQKLAAQPQVAYTVRFLETDDQEYLRGESRPAGQLSKRSIRRPVSDADFAEVLGEIRKMVRRDAACDRESGRSTVRPAVVFITPEPPLADPVVAEVLGQLVQEASVIWVIPWGTEDLMSEALTPVGTHVLGDSGHVADAVADLLVVGDRSAELNQAVNTPAHTGSG